MLRIEAVVHAVRGVGNRADSAVAAKSASAGCASGDRPAEHPAEKPDQQDEALLQTVDALETALSFYVEARKPLPVASKAKRGQRTVRPSALEG